MHVLYVCDIRIDVGFWGEGGEGGREGGEGGRRGRRGRETRKKGVNEEN